MIVGKDNLEIAYSRFRELTFDKTDNVMNWEGIAFLSECALSRSIDKDFNFMFSSSQGTAMNLNRFLRSFSLENFLDYLLWKRCFFEGKYTVIKKQQRLAELFVIELILHLHSENVEDNLHTLLLLMRNELLNMALLNEIVRDYYFFHGQYQRYFDEAASIMPVNSAGRRQYHSPYRIPLQILAHNYSGLAQFLLSRGSYVFEKSGFFLKCKDARIVEIVIEEVFSAVDKAFTEHGLCFPEYFFGNLRERTWVPYKALLVPYDEEIIYSTLPAHLMRPFEWRGIEYIFRNTAQGWRYVFSVPVGKNVEYMEYEHVLYDTTYASCLIDDIYLVGTIVKATEKRCRELSHYPYRLTANYKPQIYPGVDYEKYGKAQRMQNARIVSDSGEIIAVANRVVDNYVAEHNYQFDFVEKETYKQEHRAEAVEAAKQARKQQKIRLQEIENAKKLKNADVVIEMFHATPIAFFKDSSIVNYSYPLNGGRAEVLFPDSKLKVTRFSKEVSRYFELLPSLSKMKSSEGLYNTDKFSSFLAEQYLSVWFALSKISSDPYSYIDWKELILNGYLVYPDDSNPSILLMYEIVNALFTCPPTSALLLMANLWNHYYPNFQYEKDVILWIRDFWIVCCPDVSDAEFRSLFKVEPCFVGDKVLDTAVQVDISAYSADSVSDFVNDNSDYRIKSGKLAEMEKLDLLECCLQEAMKELTELFSDYGLDVYDYMGYSEIVDVVQYRIPFRRVPIYDSTYERLSKAFRWRRTGEYEICTLEYNSKKKAYMFKMDRRQISFYKGRYLIEYIGKVTELFIRDWFGISAGFIVDRTRLAELFPNELFKDNAEVAVIELAIQIAVEKVCMEQGYQRSASSVGSIDKYRKSSASINLSEDDRVSALQFRKLQLASIIAARNTLRKNQERLVIEDDTDQINKESHDTKNTPKKSFLGNLGHSEIEFLGNLLHNVENVRLPDYETTRIVSIINETAIDFWGEAIIDDTTTPVLFDEYIDTLNTLFQEQGL